MADVDHLADAPHERDASDDEELLGGADGGEVAEAVVARELGPDAASVYARLWRAEKQHADEHPLEEGLRERKKRQTRQRISDIATALFLARGFDAVKVAEIAAKVGVSEKTIYNYFPTKESLVFDSTDAQMAALATALRDRGPGVSATAAIVAELKKESHRFVRATGTEGWHFLPRFGEMLHDTPALRAAWAEHRNRLVDAITGILAEEARVDPREPEPIVAARALVSLVELLYDSLMRHVKPGVTGEEVRAAVNEDLDRAARLLDTGLWSLHLMVEGRRTKQQLLDAALGAEQARRQVMAALRDAKRAWRELHSEGRVALRNQREALQEQRAAGRRMRGRGRA